MNDSSLYLLVAALAVFLILPRLRAGKTAKPEEVLAKIRAGARILDVRSRGEFSSGAYPKAKNLPVEELAARLGELGAKDKPLVVYCASGARSAQAARILRQAGFTEVLNAGGLGAMPTGR